MTLPSASRKAVKEPSQPDGLRVKDQVAVESGAKKVTASTCPFCSMTVKGRAKID